MSDVTPIQLRQVRDLGQNISDTFTFLKQNWQGIYKPVLLVGAPPLVICGLLIGLLMNNVKDLAASGVFDTGSAFTALGSFIVPAILAYLMMLAVYLLCFSMVNEYVRAYMLGEHHTLTTGALVKRGLGQLGSYFGLGFLSMLIIIGSMLLLIIPGIYCAVALSIAPACHAVERSGASGSISRAFTLIKDKWWETFGILIVMGLIEYVIQQVLTLPINSILGIGEFTGMTGGPDDEAAGITALTIWFPVLMIVSLGTGLITYPISSVANAMRYFSLVEQKENVGLRDQVRTFDSL